VRAQHDARTARLQADDGRCRIGFQYCGHGVGASLVSLRDAGVSGRAGL
jgi:hypothetical protein